MCCEPELSATILRSWFFFDCKHQNAAFVPDAIELDLRKFAGSHSTEQRNQFTPLPLIERLLVSNRWAENILVRSLGAKLMRRGVPVSLRQL